MSTSSTHYLKEIINLYSDYLIKYASYQGIEDKSQSE